MEKRNEKRRVQKFEIPARLCKYVKKNQNRKQCK